MKTLTDVKWNVIGLWTVKLWNINEWLWMNKLSRLVDVFRPGETNSSDWTWRHERCDWRKGLILYTQRVVGKTNWWKYVCRRNSVFYKVPPNIFIFLYCIFFGNKLIIHSFIHSYPISMDQWNVILSHLNAAIEKTDVFGGDFNINMDEGWVWWL
jgi:hypothetical protein